MKSPKMQLLCLAASTLPYAASAEYTELATSQTVVFALTETYSAPALQEKDDDGKLLKDEYNKTIPTYWNEYSVDTYKGEDLVKSVYTEEYAATMKTAKISNKEILVELMEAEVIESIVGYSISFIDTVEEDQLDDDGFYLVKKGAEPISINEYLSVNFSEDIEDIEPFAESGKYSYVETQDFVKETSTSVVTGSEKFKEGVSISFVTPTFTAIITGIGSFGSSVKTFGKGVDAYFADIPTAGIISSASGGLRYAAINPEEYFDDSVLEGSISYGAGVPLPLPVPTAP
jgi:hypothetical protein